MLNKWYLYFSFVVIGIQAILFPLLFTFANHLVEPFFIAYAVFFLVVLVGILIFYIRIPKRKNLDEVGEFDEMLIAKYLGKTKIVTKNELIALRRRNMFNLAGISLMNLIIPTVVYFINIF